MLNNRILELTYLTNESDPYKVAEGIGIGIKVVQAFFMLVILLEPVRRFFAKSNYFREKPKNERIRRIKTIEDITFNVPKIYKLDIISDCWFKPFHLLRSIVFISGVASVGFLGLPDTAFAMNQSEAKTHFRSSPYYRYWGSAFIFYLNKFVYNPFELKVAPNPEIASGDTSEQNSTTDNQFFSVLNKRLPGLILYSIFLVPFLVFLYWIRKRKYKFLFTFSSGIFFCSLAMMPLFLYEIIFFVRQMKRISDAETSSGSKVSNQEAGYIVGIALLVLMFLFMLWDWWLFTREVYRLKMPKINQVYDKTIVEMTVETEGSETVEPTKILETQVELKPPRECLDDLVNERVRKKPLLVETIAVELSRLFMSKVIFEEDETESKWSKYYNLLWFWRWALVIPTSYLMKSQEIAFLAIFLVLNLLFFWYIVFLMLNYRLRSPSTSWLLVLEEGALILWNITALLTWIDNENTGSNHFSEQLVQVLVYGGVAFCLLSIIFNILVSFYNTFGLLKVERDFTGFFRHKSTIETKKKTNIVLQAEEKQEDDEISKESENVDLANRDKEDDFSQEVDVDIHEKEEEESESKSKSSSESSETEGTGQEEGTDEEGREEGEDSSSSEVDGESSQYSSTQDPSIKEVNASTIEEVKI